MKAIHLFRTKNVIVYSLLFWVFILSYGCGDGEIPEADCKAMDGEIDILKTKYFAAPNAGNCQYVVKAYDNYINGKCGDASSYVNSRDKFKADHCP